MYNIVFTFENGMMLTNWMGLLFDLSPINGYNVNYETYTLPNGLEATGTLTNISGIDRTVKGVVWSDNPESAAKQLNDIFFAFSEKAKGKVILPAFLPSGASVERGLVKSDFVVKKTPEFVKHSGNKIIFMAQIYSASPYWANDTISIKDMPSDSKITYEGTVPTYIEKIVITASVEGIVPAIVNDTTGEGVSFSNDITIPINGSIEITFLPERSFKAIRFDGEETVDITSKMVDFSQPIRLMPGENSFFTRGANVQLQYYNQYSGVSLIYGY